MEWKGDKTRSLAAPLLKDPNGRLRQSLDTKHEARVRPLHRRLPSKKIKLVFQVVEQKKSQRYILNNFWACALF